MGIDEVTARMTGGTGLAAPGGLCGAIRGSAAR